MQDVRVHQLARLLVEYSANVQADERVAIMCRPEALPLAEALYQAALARGGHPELLLDYELTDELLLKHGSPAQIGRTPAIHQLVFENFEVLFKVRGEANTRALSGVNPQAQARRREALAPVLGAQLRRGAVGQLKWVVCCFPTLAYAQDADMSLGEYEDFVYGACHVGGPDDPVAFWKQVQAEQQRLADFMQGKDVVQVNSKNVDLTLSVKGRTWLNSCGTHNMPDGEIYTGPVENSVNGWVRFTYPGVYGGREVDGIELGFDNGRVVRATARKNEDFLLKTIDTDPGARTLGEFAIGTNFGVTRFTKSILFDEKIGGTIHMALGAGYPETGSHNVSAVHWDMICEMRQGEIRVDGQVFYRNGEFKV